MSRKYIVCVCGSSSGSSMADLITHVLGHDSCAIEHTGYRALFGRRREPIWADDWIGDVVCSFGMHIHRTICLGLSKTMNH